MKFNTVKSKVLLFLSILTLLGTIFCIVSCDDYLYKNVGMAIININLDLSNLINNSRNEDSQLNGYVLDIFVYNAKNYKKGDEIENLSKIAETSSNVVNGKVNANLELSIGSNVIFVGKFFTLEDNIKSDKPLYAGKSDVYKVLPYNNKVKLVLSRDTAEIGFDIELQEIHEHIFGETIVLEEATEETEGSMKVVCTVCGYEVVAEIPKLSHTHKFAEWEIEFLPSYTQTGSKKRECKTCTYIETKEIPINPEGLVYIPAGSFQMGSLVEDAYNGNNKPVLNVAITKDFYMSKYEITQGEYEKYCKYGGSSPTSTDGDGDDYPAYYVSWYDALVYCNKRSIAEGFTPCYSINEKTNPEEWGEVPTSTDSTWDGVECDWVSSGYRLPTEAEWEYAARAGDTTVNANTYSGTNDSSKLSQYANVTLYNQSGNGGVSKVGTKLPNAFGLYDMSGCLWEFCWNWITESYNVETEGGLDPTGALSGSKRVQRGGCRELGSSYCTVTYRSSLSSYIRGDLYGFRVVRSAVTTE